MVDGNEYNVLLEKLRGSPIEVVYPSEGTPVIISPSAIMKNSKNPNAARLFHSWSFSKEAQQIGIDVGQLRTLRLDIPEPPTRKRLSEIKLMKDDPASVDQQVEEIKRRYLRLFKT